MYYRRGVCLKCRNKPTTVYSVKIHKPDADGINGKFLNLIISFLEDISRGLNTLR